MAKRISTGIICPTTAAHEYFVTTYGKDKKTYKPTGVFLAGNKQGLKMTLEYAGINGALDGFHLPRDPEFLRDIAKAFEMIADEIEEYRKGGP
jgi:hypothetical protein